MCGELGCALAVKHVSDIGSRETIQVPGSPYIQAKINEKLDKMLGLGIVEKKNGDHRFCVDFRKLNAISKRGVIEYSLFHLHSVSTS